MATSYQPNPPDGRQWSPSPRPKTREPKDILCRNITIYGYCRREKDGCPYNHNPGQGANSTASAIGTASLNKRLNVESPAFMPGGAAGARPGSASKSAGMSPKLADAAPFTPKNAKPTSATSPPSSVRGQSADWHGHNIPEFVPKAAQTDPTYDDNDYVGAHDPFQSYDGASGYIDESVSHQHNPYLENTGAGPGQPTYFSQQTHFTQPLQYHLYAPLGPRRENILPYQRTLHDLFLPETLRQDLQRRQEATLQVMPNSNLPVALEHFHSLVPLDFNNQKSATVFGYPSWVYKATSSKDGNVYALRRLEGFRLTSEKYIHPVVSWKRIINANNVTLHDCFTTRLFGDSSIIFVTDYHPVSKTFAEQYFAAPTLRGQRITNEVVSEQTMWSYLVQLASALRTIHSNNLAARAVVPSKILITSKNRIRLNTCGVLDVVQPIELSSATVASLQQDDLRQVGLLMLAIASRNPSVIPTNLSADLSNLLQSHSIAKALESFGRTYSARLRQAVAALLSSSPEHPMTGNVSTFTASISDHVMSSFDASLHADDALTDHLARELENGRLVRLLAKLGCINERPEYNPANPSEPHPHSTVAPQQQLPPGHAAGPPGAYGGAPPTATALKPHVGAPKHAPSSAWSETGSRYLLKLFRDHVFHPISTTGAPLLSLTHIVENLNKLDAGSDEKMRLVSRDGNWNIIVSYKEVKRAVESAWVELVRLGTSSVAS